MIDLAISCTCTVIVADVGLLALAVEAKMKSGVVGRLAICGLTELR